ncbi:hypothetical protein [Mycetocola manganoxydans]|uniref:hypothetical protein n=1 Tax=Mycetocola manganoxydans TaxID=699879 RepID=UPI0016015B42|nr:hypothetical protein [Mycetocola manganoxydans]GHD44045.1 hypothetical protein GCM10008097_11560 [Mycetocola manganoxydans]
MISTPAGPPDASPSIAHASEPSSTADPAADGYDEFHLDYDPSAGSGTSFSDLDFPLA